MPRRLARALAPLVAWRTYKGWTHLILGGALLVPFVMLAILVLGATIAPDGLGGLLIVLGVVAGSVPLAGVVAYFIPTFRAVEAVAARDLLDVPLEDVDGDAHTPAARRRTAAWVVAHLGAASVVCSLTLTVPVSALYLAVQPIVDGGSGRSFALSLWRPLVAVVMCAGLVYLVAAATYVLRRLAPSLLGPTPEARLSALERQAERLAQRNRLARELHDSVGHALSIITVQAGAAKRVQAADPAFVGGALTAIEDASRRALEDLDHVLGLLREDAEAGRRPQPTLADLDRLVASTRAAGVTLEVDVTGPVGGVPPAVSREAYRIVQEGLTNALRHAPQVPVSLRAHIGIDTLDIAITNPLAASRAVPAVPAGAGTPAAVAGAGAAPSGSVAPSDSGTVASSSSSGSSGGPGSDPGHGRRRGGGRGLAGIRERVTVLRGTMVAGADAGCWKLVVSLPLRSPS